MKTLGFWAFLPKGDSGYLLSTTSLSCRLYVNGYNSLRELRVLYVGWSKDVGLSGPDRDIRIDQ